MNLVEWGRRGMAVVLALAFSVGCSPSASTTGGPASDPEGAGGAEATVTRVIDGDTIEVVTGGREETVRLIGVDTPESVHPTVPDECFGKRASAFTERSLEGEDVRLEYDAERLDRYGRTLAYVWVGGMFNEELVRQGYASAYPYPPNTRYADLFEEAERDARDHGRGLWGSCPL